MGLTVSWQDRFDASLTSEDRDAIKLAADWLRAQPDRVNDDVVEGSEPQASKAALAYLRWRAQRGDDFAFTRDLAQHVRERGPVLSLGQVRGLLNCLRADALRADKLRAERAARDSDAAPQAAPPTPGSFEVPSGIPAGYYTLVEEDGEHRTFRLLSPTWGDFGDDRLAVSLLVGPANEADYLGVGFYWPEGGRFQAWQKAKPHKALALRLLTALGNDGFRAAGGAYALASGNCWRCNRRLTTPESIAAGIGPVCADKL